MKHIAPSNEAKTCIVCHATFKQRVGDKYTRQEFDDAFRLRRCCSHACRLTFYKKHPFFIGLSKVNLLPRRPKRTHFVNKGNNCIYCDTPAKIRGMCFAHYARWKKSGDAHVIVKQVRKVLRPLTRIEAHKTCERCDRQVYRDTLCAKHRQEQKLIDGEIEAIQAPLPNMTGKKPAGPPPKTCALCDRPHRNRGLCSPHYVKYLAHQRVLKAARNNA